MRRSTVRQEILERLDALPANQQERVLEFTRSLAPSRPKGVPGKDLLRFAGTLDPEEARRMREVIEAGCERVDSGEW